MPAQPSGFDSHRDRNGEPGCADAGYCGDSNCRAGCRGRHAVSGLVDSAAAGRGHRDRPDFSLRHPALFIGIWCGALILNGPGLTSVWTAFLDSFDTHLVNAIADTDRIRVLLFTMMLGGMIGILVRNGGMRGIVARTTRFASNAVRGQLVTASLGLVIFFDDIANTLLIGKTMRPVTDRLRISRENWPTLSIPRLRRSQALPSHRPGLATKCLSSAPRQRASPDWIPRPI